MNRYLALQKIVETGSFTKAAQALGYTQSSISQMISSLEGELQLKLLHRSRIGVRLSDEGLRLYPDIERAINQYKAMIEKAKAIRGLEAAIIKIGTISSITCHWLPHLMSDFQKLHPDVQFVLHQGDYNSIPEWIRIGAVDFGFISPDAIKHLETINLKQGNMVAVVPKNHKLATRKSLRLAELVDDPFILLEEGDYCEPLEAFEQANLQPNVKFRLHDDYAIMTMVEAGLGISILAELVLRRTNFDLAMVPLDPPLERTLAICFQDKASLPIASRYFIDFILANKEKLP